MALADLIRGDFGVTDVATAILAIPATVQAPNGQTVAKVATVAVANSENAKSGPPNSSKNSNCSSSNCPEAENAPGPLAGLYRQWFDGIEEERAYLVLEPEQVRQALKVCAVSQEVAASSVLVAVKVQGAAGLMSIPKERWDGMEALRIMHDEDPAPGPRQPVNPEPEDQVKPGSRTVEDICAEVSASCEAIIQRIYAKQSAEAMNEGLAHLIAGDFEEWRAQNYPPAQHLANGDDQEVTP